MTLAPGDTLERYVVISLLGHGGMGEVYLAEDTRLRRRIALKVLRSGHARGDDVESEGSARLVREAQAAAALDHPNAVTVHDVGVVDGVAYLAMEYVEGRPLRAFVGDASIDVAVRVRWLSDVARALSAAHLRGLVHRDVKPENVMLRNDGVIKVLDFGLARRPGGAVDPTGDTSTPFLATLTGEGVVVGTPLYMSPEQLRAEIVDARSDQFSWGVLAYELLTGKPPWDVGDGAKLVADIVSKTPIPPSAVNPDISAAIDAGVMRTLAKAATDRFETMDALLLAIGAIAGVSPTPSGRAAAESPGGISTRTAVASRSAHETARRRRWWLAGAAVGVASMAGVATHMRSGGTDTGVARAPSSPASAASITVMTDSVPKTTNPEAAAAYAAAMQSYRDGSADAGRTQLQRALALEPSLAAAHLRLIKYAAEESSTDEVRRHLTAALELRGTLADRDLEIVRILEPVIMREVPDWDESERRAVAAVARFPGDAELAWKLGQASAAAGKPADADRAFDRASSLDPKFALPFATRADYEIGRRDMDAALATVARCLEVSPSAASCLASRAAVLIARGECKTLAAEARRNIAMNPGGHDGYWNLAAALAAENAPMESVRGALRKYAELRERAEPGGLNLLEQDLTIAVYGGDFTSAESLVVEMEKRRASDASEQQHGLQTIRLLRIYAETGETAKAIEAAESFTRRSAAWIHDESQWVRAEVLAVRRRAHKLTDRELIDARDALVVHQLALRERPHQNGVWTDVFARPAADARDGEEAIAALPKFSPLPYMDVRGAGALGRAYFFAGKMDEAVAALSEETRSCAGLLGVAGVIDLVRDHAFLGRALEQKGDEAGACAAYRHVLERWGAAKPRSMSADLARRRSRALRCPKE